MRKTLLLALQLFTAAALSLVLAWWLGLANPYWAAMPVWVVHQAYREDLVSRAALRVAGTLAGAVAALAVVYLQPPVWVEMAVLSLGVGLAAAAAHRIGSVMSYGAFMAGVTLFVVLLPNLAGISASDGVSVMAASVDRILCTLVGVLCVTAVTFPFTPPRENTALLRPAGNRIRGSLLRLAYCSSTTAAAAGLALAFPRFDVVSGAMTLIVYPLILSCAPSPSPILRALVPGVTLGALAALAYIFLLGSFCDGLWSAAVLLTAAFLAAGALLRAWPLTAPYGLDANMCFLIVADVGAWRHGVSDVAPAGLAVIAAAAFAGLSGRLTLLANPARP